VPNREIELLENGHLKQVQANDLPLEILELLKQILDEAEELLLIVKRAKEYWVITNSLHLIKVQRKPYRYPLAEISAIGLWLPFWSEKSEKDKDLEFIYEGKQVRVPEGVGLLSWLYRYGISPKYQSIEYIGKKGKVCSKPWAEVELLTRKAIEHVLMISEIPIFIVESGVGWVCTDSALINLNKRPPRRFEFEKINDVTYHVGWASESVEFNYEDHIVHVPEGGAIFWALVERWPRLAEETLVQNYELKENDSALWRIFQFGCLRYTKDTTSTLDELLNQRVTRLTYAFANCHILAKRRGGKNEYFQIIDCPLCGDRILVRIKKGEPKDIRSKSVMTGKVPLSLMMPRHRPWSELQRK